MQTTGRWWIVCVLAFQVLAAEAADYRAYGGFRPLGAEEQRLIDSQRQSGYSSSQQQSKPLSPRMPERVLQPHVVPSQTYVPPAGNYRFRELSPDDTVSAPRSAAKPYPVSPGYPGALNTGNPSGSGEVPFTSAHSYSGFANSIDKPGVEPTPPQSGSPRYPGSFSFSGPNHQERQVHPQPVFRPLDGDKTRRKAADKRPFSRAMPPGPVYPYGQQVPYR